MIILSENAITINGEFDLTYSKIIRKGSGVIQGNLIDMIVDEENKQIIVYSTVNIKNLYKSIF